MAYESFKQLLVKYQGHQSPSSPGAVAGAGAICGVVSLASTYAMDRAKTEYQTAFLRRDKLSPLPKDVAGSTQPKPKVHVSYFNKGSYTGFGVSAARSAVTHAVLFSCFEAFKIKINDWDEAAMDSKDGPKV
jgi:hypothetical protein